MIRLFLTDCDGCLTDGGMYYTESGDEFKRFNAVDGMGFQLLREQGIRTGIVTGENTNIVSNRAKKLNVDYLLQGEKNKLEAVTILCREHGISMQEVAYIGDDINDLALIRAVRYGCCVSNAMEAVKQEAIYISKASGGNGAVREIIEWLLERHFEDK